MWLHQSISGGVWVIFLGDMMNLKNVLMQVFFFFSLGQIQSQVKSQSLKIKLFLYFKKIRHV